MAQPLPLSKSTAVSLGVLFCFLPFLPFANDFLPSTDCSMHSYADNTTPIFIHFFQICSILLRSIYVSCPNYLYKLGALDRISHWGKRNLNKFNTTKTQFLSISLFKTPHNFTISSYGFIIPPLNKHSITVTSYLPWNPPPPIK